MHRRTVRYIIAPLLIVALLLSGAAAAKYLLPYKLFISGKVSSSRIGDFTYFQYIPDLPAGTKPTATLITLAGLGGDAESCMRDFIPFAREHQWTVLAPDFAYPMNSTFEDEAQVLHSLHDAAQSLSSADGKVLLYGFSRGAQTAHRFALSYPDHVLAAAVMSAGNYTIPDKDLNYPLGVQDISKYTGDPFNAQAFRKVPFWVGVGDKDNVVDDVARAWDPYIGNTRLDRAWAFASSLNAFGVREEMHVFPNQGHADLPGNRDSGLAFLLAQTESTN